MPEQSLSSVEEERERERGIHPARGGGSSLSLSEQESENFPPARKVLSRSSSAVDGSCCRFLSRKMHVRALSVPFNVCSLDFRARKGREGERGPLEPSSLPERASGVKRNSAALAFSNSIPITQLCGREREREKKRDRLLRSLGLSPSSITHLREGEREGESGAVKRGIVIRRSLLIPCCYSLSLLLLSPG